jgi:tellurite resistance protein
MNLLGGLNKHIARHKNRDFLDAALAVSVLATQADGSINGRIDRAYRVVG